MSYSGPYSVRTRENTDQDNYEYRHFLRMSFVDFVIFSRQFILKSTRINHISFTEI